MIREPLAAEVRLGQLVALDHRAHRAVEDEDPLSSRQRSVIERIGHLVSPCASAHDVGAGSVWLRGLAALRACGALRTRRLRFAPLAISTVNGSPVLRAPTPTLTSVRPASVEQRRQLASSKPERADRRAARAPTPRSCSRRSSISTRPPGDDDARGFGDARVPGRCGVVQRLRQHRDVDAAVAAAAASRARPASR